MAKDVSYTSTEIPTSTTFKYKDFQYQDYKESNTVKQAKTALDTLLKQKPGAYQSQWQTQLNDVMDKILNREKFSYDVNGDALYQQYKDKYIQQGKMAMQDTMGQAAAMTGGYGNSYAASVGNQAYQASLQNLNDVIPELYQMAYDRYNQEGQDLLNQYGVITDRENTDYGRYRDTVSDFNTERDYLAGRYDSERSFDYSKYTDQRDFAYQDYSDDKSYAYNNHRDKIADNQWAAEFEEAMNQYKTSLAEQQRQFNAQYGANTTGIDNTGGNTGDAPGGVGIYDNGGYGDSIVKQAQNFVGATADGKWGADSAAKAKAKGYNSLAEVVAAAGLGGSQPTKKYADFSNEEYNKKSKENGGSHYSAVLSDLKQMKAKGMGNKEAQAYLEEMVGNSYITRSDYSSLYNKYRDGKLG